MSIAAAIRFRDIKVFGHIKEFGKQSLRQIAKATSLSKSGVARSMDAIAKRDKYPESYMWETEEGQVWLHRMVIAVLYEFGVKGNQGAERISEFLKRIRVDSHVGVSPSAVRDRMRRMEKELVKFQQEQETKQGQKEGEKRAIVASGDETWFNEKMLLVLMDLSSGYLITQRSLIFS